MHYRDIYEGWLRDPYIDDATKHELLGISRNEAEIEDRFFKQLAFGTGGMRGVRGAGTNRLNIYTVRRATQGLANHILSQGCEAAQKGVAIAYDSRHMSPEFAMETALVMCGNNIPAYVFDGLRPTPFLSFAVRHLGCTAGVVITASHNTQEYNGYKVYSWDGGQVTYPLDKAIIKEVNAVNDFSQIRILPKDEATAENLYRMSGPEVDDAYIKAVMGQSLHPEIPLSSPLRIVYTPLHGTGNVPVRRILSEVGFKHVLCVPEQTEPNGDFPTVPSPNPEKPEAFAMALAMAGDENADLVIGTDPDCDRMGAFVKAKEGGYVLLTGNMIGLILTEYILSQRKEKGSLPDNGAIISTIVSTGMGRRIAKTYGMAYISVLTGFKYIGEKIKEFDQTGQHTFIFGFEESYGYLAGTHARDKDAVVASMLLCEAAAYYKKHDETLMDVLDRLYIEYGYFEEAIDTKEFEGAAGQESIRRTMEDLRANPPDEIGGVRIVGRRDYLNDETGLPASDVLHYVMEDSSWLCIRPSGTEPLIKVYYGVHVIPQDKDLQSARETAAKRLTAMSQVIVGIIPNPSPVLV